MMFNLPSCQHCKRFDSNTATCEAFPKKIPSPIWTGANDHTKPFPGDHGLLFVPMTDAEMKAREQVERRQLALAKVTTVLKGGPGSGNYGHSSVPGQQGGSAPAGSKDAAHGARRASYPRATARQRLSIAQSSSLLTARGMKLNSSSAQSNLKNWTTTYEVTDASGKTQRLAAKEIQRLLTSDRNLF